MPIEIDSVNFKLTFKDMFYFNVLYNALHDYVIMKKFAKNDEDFPEKFYLIDTDASGKRNVQIWWRFSKFEGENDFFKHDLDINYKCTKLGKAEASKDGKKIEVDMGEIEIEVKSKLYMDAKDAWNKNSFNKFIFEKFWKRWYAKIIKEQKEIYEADIVKIQDMIKGYFGVGGSLPPMVPLRGIGF